MTASVVYQPFCDACAWSPYGYSDEQSAFAAARDHDEDNHGEPEEGEDA